MRNKLVLLWALLAALAVVAAACGSDDDSVEPAAAEADDGAGGETESTVEADDGDAAVDGDDGDASEPAEAVELRFVIWDEAQLATQQQLADTFTAANPNITVDIEVIPFADYWPAVQTAVAGGDGFDVMWMNGPNFPSFASSGILLPISDLVERDGVDLSPFPEPLIDLYTRDGQLYGISKDFDTIGLYYNVAMFDEAGLDYPDETWTWDDLKAAATALTTDDRWGFAATTWEQMVLFNLIPQAGGQVISEDGDTVLYGEPAACSAFEFLNSFHDEGISPDQITLDTTNQWDLFSSQRVAMMYEGSWQAKAWADLDFQVEVAPLPGGAERSNTIHGLSWSILAGTDHPEEAWEFLKFLATEEAHLIQASTGSVIPSFGGTQQSWIDSFAGDMQVQVLLDEVDVAKPFPLADAPLQWATEASDVIRDALRGNLEFPEACAQAADAANGYIADNRVDG